jgi:C-terminal processing protease CtpA/Prc
MVNRDLDAVLPVGNLGLIGKTKDGFCYVRIKTLANVSDEELRKLSNEIAQRFDAAGFIIDLRENTGGSELIAQDIAGLFANDEFVYAKSARRNGPKQSDFSQPADRILRPTGGKTGYDGPIVCLIGPNTVSSAEGFAMMMKALPNCTLVGQSTRGASGNPASIQLPNGVEVWYSRWKSLTPEETCIEGVGVEPHVQVQRKRNADPAYNKAIEILKQK